MTEKRAPETDEGREGPAAVSFVVDAIVEGKPVLRGTTASVVGRTLQLEERQLSLDSLFWVARRAGLLLLFGRDYTLALQADKEQLEELARTVERLIGREAQRRLLQPFSREVIVCTAGAAVSGRVEGITVHGLHLAVFTQRALHLLAGDRHHAVRWPADARRVPSDSLGRQALELRTGETQLRLLYLFPEELQAVERVAAKAPAPDEVASEEDTALEMFARGEVAPPPPVALPEFAVSADTIRVASVHGAARVTVSPAHETLDQDFFEDHFRELGEIALGPLLLRKSAAAVAESMAAGVTAIDAASLREDARAATAAAATHVAEVFNGRLEAVSDDTSETALGKLRMTVAETTELAERMDAALDELARLHERLAAGQERLAVQLRALDEGPPDAEELEMEQAAAEWRTALGTLDGAYGRVWRQQLEGIAALWSDELIPRLEQASVRPVRRLPEWARLLMIGMAALLTGALLVILL